MPIDNVTNAIRTQHPECLVGSADQLVIPRIAMPQKATLDEQMGLLNQDKARIEFVRSSYNDITAFFQEASRDYDSDLCNPYWAFAHDILKFILAKHITEHFRNTSQIRVFDAGAGTGNWSRFVLTLGTGIRGIMFDMNPCMLKVAVPKLVQARGNTGCVEGDLEVLADFPSQRSNLVLCMHNVIGFGRSTSAILRNLYIYLEPGGLAFVMTTNKYHAFNFTSQLRGRAEALRVVRDSTVKFKPDMPEMFCYTPREFEDTLRVAGFENVTVLGFPVTVYPTVHDTQLLQKEVTIQQLSDPKTRADLLALEKQLCLDTKLAYRAGSSLIAICKKSLSAG